MIDSTPQQIKDNAPEGATHYTPTGTLYVRDRKGQNVEVCRMGSDKWMEIPMTLDECYVKPL